MRPVRILIVLTYFHPYKSGLTIYALRQAQALATMGHAVTVLTSQHEPSLSTQEQLNGVEVIRLPIAFRFSKGAIMPQLPIKAWGLIKNTDIVNIHVPQGDAAIIAVLAKLLRKPIVLTYQCDLKMPTGWVNQLAGGVANLSSRVSARMADAVVHITRDFAEHSSFLRRYLDKLKIIQPPISVAPVSEEEIEAFCEKYALQPERRIIGMVARLAAEKGVEYLVEAMPMILESLPNAQVVFVGEYENVIGEKAYKKKILPMIDSLGDHWAFLGPLKEAEKTAFFHLCDVLVLPSVNSTESFGMVQIEALTCGTPVVASNLPGVRQPVLTTGMGKIVPLKDPKSLASAIRQILEAGISVPPDVIDELIDHYSPEKVAEAYEALFHQLIDTK